jgi:holliday junction DNA helicase RuvA
MIGRLAGILVEKNPPQVVVDCNGVGYEVDVPMSTYYDLPSLGEKVVLLIHQVVREDANLLFGFARAQERMAFRELVRISGIGPRTALSVLSGLSVQDLAEAVTLQQAVRLTQVPGIGKKTAERLLLELKGRIGADLTSPAGGLADASTEVLHALLALGYSEKEATLAARQLPKAIAVTDGIRQALKALARI